MPYQQEDRLNQQIGEYRLVRKLGGGGFGIVYLAEHIQEHFQAAMKVLDVRLTRSEDFKDFLNEVRTILLRHPHIVPLLDFGISREDLPFLVMEYAPEGTLRDLHPKGARIPLSTIVSYVDQLASALQYAHDQRVIHRDVKPENILVRTDGTLLVSDFGIAKLMEQSVLLSVQTQVGTPVYMAPEQHLGYPCFASDQYALAVVIYEWICGVRPFQGTTIGLAMQHLNTPPMPLRHYVPELAPAIESVILKGLAKTPEERFGRIQDFADALREAVQATEGTGVRPPAITKQLSPQAANEKLEALASALADTAEKNQEPAKQVDALAEVEETQKSAKKTRAFKDMEETQKPAKKTTDVSALEKGKEETPVAGVQDPPLLPPSRPHISRRTTSQLVRQNTALSTTHRLPPWIKIPTIVVTCVLVLSLVVGSIALFVFHIGNPTNKGGIGIIIKPNNEQIGISDGTYAFDTGPDRADAALKIQAAAKFAQGDKVGATSLWNQAVQVDTSDAEALIYLENQRVLDSGSPYITLVVGTLLTGDSSNLSEGRDNLQGSYVAQKEYNDAVKLRGGKKIRLLIANAGSQPKEYTLEVAQMIVQAVKEDPTIVGVVGWPYSANALAAAPILGNAHIPMLSSDASTDDLTKISPYFFRIVPPNKSQAIAGAKYAEQQLHAKNVALFVDPNDPYSNTLAVGFRQQFVDTDGNKIIDTETYKRSNDQARLPGLLQKALASNPDLIYFAGYANDLDVLLRNFPASQPDLPVLGGDSFNQLGAYSPSTPLSRLRFTTFSYPDEWSILGMTNPQPFFDEYKAAFNPRHEDHSGSPYGFTRPDSDTILSYDAMVVFLQGCQNGLAIKDPLTTEALRQGLTQIRGEKALQGVSGQISLGSDGNPIDKAVVIVYYDQDRHLHMFGVQGCFVLGHCG